MINCKDNSQPSSWHPDTCDEIFFQDKMLVNNTKLYHTFLKRYLCNIPGEFNFFEKYIEDYGMPMNDNIKEWQLKNCHFHQFNFAMGNIISNLALSSESHTFQKWQACKDHRSFSTIYYDYQNNGNEYIISLLNNLTHLNNLHYQYQNIKMKEGKLSSKTKKYVIEIINPNKSAMFVISGHRNTDDYIEKLEFYYDPIEL